MKPALLARQPIFDSKQKTHAYELLYRGDLRKADDDAMTATALSNLLNQFGMDTVTDGNPIFVNVSKSFLLSDFPELLPASRTTLEVLEDVPADDDVIASLEYWKNKGFTIALDDFISVDCQHIQLLPHTDIVKVDIMAYEGDLGDLVTELRKHPVKLLAEKVETHGQYELCKKLGFDFFQGYFFCKPSLMVDHHSLDANKGRLLQLLSRTLEAEAPMDLENDIAHDMALSFKLLCYINSASVGLRTQVDSIGHALALMGLDNIRVWISMLLMASLSKDKPNALLSTAFARGRFMELLATSKHEERQANDYFILGMFSLLDAMLDISMEEAVESVSLPRLIKDGLLDNASDSAIRLKLMRSLEKADWVVLDELLHIADIDDTTVSSFYNDSLQWADERVKLMNSL